jgi:hypothetical protein
MKEIKIISTSSFGAYSDFAEVREQTEQELKVEPDAIVAQGTSSDPGPGYMTNMWQLHSPTGTKDVLSFLLASAKKKGLPLIASMGAPSGTDYRLERTLGMISEGLKEKRVKFNAAVISGEIDKEYLKSKLREGEKVKRLIDHPSLPEYLSIEDVENSTSIVSQMGPEPIMEALDLDVDGVITGRALDTGLYMAMPLKKGFDKGLAAHMAKTIECSGLCTVFGTGSVIGTMRKDHFLVEPVDPKNRCTVTSVAAHSFYERRDITMEPNPGGILDISEAKFEQYDERTVKVWGAKWIPQKYAVKIEGAARVGYRTIAIAGVRDPILISLIDEFLESVRDDVRAILTPVQETNYKLLFHVYGRNGVMGESEPLKETTSHELCVLVEVVAKTQELADDILQRARSTMNHISYPGRKATASNIAWPFSPLHISCGPVYAFTIWHGLELEDPCEPFRRKVMELGEI